MLVLKMSHTFDDSDATEEELQSLFVKLMEWKLSCVRHISFLKNICLQNIFLVSLARLALGHHSLKIRSLPCPCPSEIRYLT